MRTKLVGLLSLFLIATVPSPSQDKRGASTEEERAKALTAIDDLEKDPLGPNAKEERRWLTIWLIEVPDIQQPALDELLNKRKAGTLGNYIKTQVAAHCAK
jgi:hypothetical protein